jgi:hypothetical protein
MKKRYVIIAFLFSIVILSAQTEDWFWAQSGGGTGTDEGRDIARDNQGNLCVTGSFFGTATFGSFTVAASSGGIFVAKISSTGTWLWAVSALPAASGNLSSARIASDSAGNFYITGYYTGNASFGTITLSSSGYNDVFVAKLSSAGTWLWAVSAGGTGNDEGCGIVVNGSSNVYVCGYYTTTAVFGSITLTNSVPGAYAFVVKLNNTGNWLSVVDATASVCRNMTLDNEGNICISGTFAGDSATFGNITISGMGGTVYFARLDSNLNWYWAKSCTSYSGSLLVNDIATDSSGKIFATGSYTGVLYTMYELYSAGQSDIFVAGVDDWGYFDWGTRAGGSTQDYGRGLAIDSNGNVYITGSFNRTADFGSIPLACPNNDASDIFVAKLNSAGIFQWAKRAGGDPNDSGYGINVTDDFNLFLTGYFSSHANFVCNWLNSVNDTHDIFVAEIVNIVPKTPASLIITRNGADVQLNWNAVTQYTNNQPVVPDYYLVYSSSSPFSGFSLLGLSVGTVYLHSGGASTIRKFYRITAIKN